MASVVRRARPADTDGIIRLVRARTGNYVTVRDVAPQDRVEAKVAHYEKYRPRLGKDNRIPVVVAEHNGELIGFLVLLPALRESITDDPQGMIFDFAFGEREDVGRALLKAADQLAAARGDRYLIVNLAVEAPQDAALFEKLGFASEMARIVKPVSTEYRPGVDPHACRLRRATPLDQMFIVHLNTLSASFTIPPNRGHEDPLHIQQRYLDAYMSLDLSPENPELCGFIAEVEGKPAGFILIKLGFWDEISMEKLGYIYDIAVHPDHQGRHVSMLLVHAAECHLVSLGYRFIVGDISSTNIRPLTVSTRHIGFTIESHRYVRAIAR